MLLISNKSWHINEKADTTFVTRLPREYAWQRQQCAVTTVTEHRAGLSMSPDGGSGLPTPRARYEALMTLASTPCPVTKSCKDGVAPSDGTGP